MEKKKGFLSIINKMVFYPPAIAVVFFILLGIFIPEQFANGASAALSWITTNFTWFYAIGATMLLAFCFWAGFSKYGRIKLGGPDAVPEMKRANWFFIALCAGIATGIVFWGVAEPMTHFANPPAFLGIEGLSVEAGQAAVPLSAFHWTFHTYGIYVSCALCMAFFYYNGKQKFLVSSGLYGLLGDRVNGNAGRLIDGLAIFAIIGGIGTSYGFGVMQIGSGLNFLWGIPVSNLLYIGIILVITAAYVTSSYTGLHKGIKYLSQTNVALYFFMLGFLLLLGPTLHLLNGLIQNVGSYFNNLVTMSFYTDYMFKTGWSGSWSIFYWAWWLAYAPIVGLFLVRCAYGRTIREFVVVNLMLPSFFGIVWFSVFGNAAIFEDFFAGANIAATIAEHGTEVSMFALFNQYPLSTVTCTLAMVAVALSFVTLSDSMTSTIAMMTTKDFGVVDGKEIDMRDRDANEAPVPLKLFWGISMGLAAYVLLSTGGTAALQSSVIVCGLPILVLQLLMAGGYIRAMIHLDEYDKMSSKELIAELMKKEQKENPAPTKDSASELPSAPAGDPA